MEAVNALDPSNGRGGRTEHAHSVELRGLEPATEARCPSGSFFEARALNDEVGERRVGWVVHPLAVLHLTLDEGVEVVLRRALDGVVIGMVGLHKDSAGELAASRAS